MGKIKYIDIDWPGLLQLIPGSDQAKYNRIRVNKEVIPIIFVPGIMGSRLKNRKTGQSVWDPDREIMCMLMKYGGFWNTPAQRKRMLIGEEFSREYLDVDEKDAAHNKKINCAIDCKRTDRGWGGVYWGSYGKFLVELQRHKWERPVISSGEERLKELVGHCFDFPVYAFGYNWTDSNSNSGEALAWKINDIIWHYVTAGRHCKFVILVSHSMGGLVCRAACKLHNAESKVLGVIHGVQPATGAPAAYWRMKAGFERTGGGLLKRLKSSAAAWVLGTNGEEVTCILGNSPGGLELLPNHCYVDNKGQRGWLRIPLRGGKELVLPRSGDPYEEIYRVKTKQFWRLINPEWLKPTEISNPQDNPYSHGKDSWEVYIQCLEQASKFHKKLQNLCHANTFVAATVPWTQDKNYAACL